MSAEEPAEEPTRPQRLVTLLLIAALVVALIAVVMLWRDRDDLMDRAVRAEQDNSSSSAGPEAEEAAREAVTQMTTYDHRTVEEDFAWVEDAGTARFQETFADASADAIELIKGFRSSAVGTVIDSAATVEDDGHVKVLLFVDQELMAPGEEGPKLEESRVVMRMVRQDGRWLVDEMQLENLLGQ